MACAMVLGENIGTTITANIAAAVGNPAAKRAALAHTVFNLFGVIWALITFPFFLKMIGAITAGIFNIPNPAAADFTVIVEKAADGTPIQTDTQTSALYGLSMLHTLFNTINTLILIWFIPFIEKLVCMIIKGSANKEENAFRLKLAFDGKLEQIANAYAAEDRINNLRNNLRDEEIESIENERTIRQAFTIWI